MARNRWSLDGRVVLITGAARGIGAEAAAQLAGRGARVVLAGLEDEELAARAADIGGARALAIALDVTDRTALDRAVERAIQRFGGLDVVIANAGIAPVGAFASIDENTFEQTIAVNLLGVWNTLRAALPAVVARRGYMLPIASLAAAVQLPLMAHYAASKAGVEALANSLRSELAHTGTRVGCAYFGFIDTAMSQAAFAHPARAGATDRLPLGLGRRLPVSEAGAAIVRGVEARARVVAAPGVVRAVLLARGLTQPLVERAVARDATLPARLAAAGDGSGSGRGAGP